MERLERATDPEIMDEQRVNMNRRLNPLVAYIPTSPVSPRSPMSSSSGSVEIVEGPAPEVIDLSIDEIEAMFMSDVADQTTQAAAQAKADAEAEEEASRSGKPVKRKKTDNTIPRSLLSVRIPQVQIRTRVENSRDYLSRHLHWKGQVQGGSSSIADVMSRSCGSMADAL